MTVAHNILALDDDRFFTNYACRLVGESGHHMEACNNPTSLNLDSLANFDIILLDIIMPGIDGIRMLGIILEHAPQTNVILMTSLDHPSSRLIMNHATEIGVKIKGALKKPFGKSELFRLLESCEVPSDRTSRLGAEGDVISRELFNTALQDGYQVLLQPQHSLPGNVWVGCQARPVHTSGAVTSFLPAEPVVEGKRLSMPASYFAGMVRQSVNSIAEINRVTGKRLSVTVPVSAIALTDLNFEHEVMGIIENGSIFPQQLVLELANHDTEMRHLLPQAWQALKRLQSSGIRVSATFNESDLGKFADLLSVVPFSEIKLDSKLVSRLLPDATLAKKVARLLEEAEHRCIASLADGIANSETLNWLSKHGCNIGQGSYLSQAQTVPDLLDWNKRNN